MSACSWVDSEGSLRGRSLDEKIRFDFTSPQAEHCVTGHKLWLTVAFKEEVVDAPH